MESTPPANCPLPARENSWMNAGQTFDRVLELAWSVIDGAATDEDRATLAKLVQSEQSSRRKYLDAVMLDADLRQLLGPDTKSTPSSITSQQIQFGSGFLPVPT